MSAKALARPLILGLLLWMQGPALALEGLEPLDIITATGSHHFSVEVMRTDAARERGLMFRKFMPDDRGMLFDFETERQVMMWMKNTFIALDMVFIDHSGKVVGLAENAEPMSETIIPSDAPASAVLELNGGAAAKIGIKKGDMVHHPLLGR